MVKSEGIGREMMAANVVEKTGTQNKRATRHWGRKRGWSRELTPVGKGQNSNCVSGESIGHLRPTADFSVGSVFHEYPYLGLKETQQRQLVLCIEKE